MKLGPGESIKEAPTSRVAVLAFPRCAPLSFLPLLVHSRRTLPVHPLSMPPLLQPPFCNPHHHPCRRSSLRLIRIPSHLPSLQLNPFDSGVTGVAGPRRERMPAWLRSRVLPYTIPQSDAPYEFHSPCICIYVLLYTQTSTTSNAMRIPPKSVFDVASDSLLSTQSMFITS